MMKKTPLIIMLLFLVFNINAYNIVPIPVSQELTKGNFTLSQKTKISYPSESKNEFEFLVSMIKETTGLNITQGADSEISLSLKDDKQLGKEGYKIEITPNHVKIEAATNAGLFYGIQTFGQMLNQSNKSKRKVVMNCTQIVDYPRFAWRGTMLDCARHYFEVDFIKQLLDNLAFHKINTFHWHLTDDQGWRIEIEAFPKLTSHSAWRDSTLVGHMCDDISSHKYDGKKYGGYYTKAQMKEIVEYAAKRHINVVPEVEMPGHAQASISAYPWLGCIDYPVDVCKYWGVIPYILNPYEPTFDFLKTVLDEVMEIFPSEYIHIGGDEAIKNQWKANKIIQKQISDLGLKNEEELQSWFINRINDYVVSKGRKIIGWDEITEGGAPKDAAIMYWRSWVKSALEEAVNGDHPIVATPTRHNYLDYRQMEDKSSEPLAINNDFTTLPQSYALEPIPDFATPEQAKNVIGTQANLWTEYISTPEHAEYMIFPRLAAVAESAWSQKELKDYDSFVGRMKTMANFYKLRKINYCDKSIK